MTHNNFDAVYWALESDQANPTHWMNIGSLLLRQASTSYVDLDPFCKISGRLALRAAVELMPDDPDVNLALGTMLEACGETEAAVQAFVGAANLDPLAPEPCERAAANLALLGHKVDVEHWADEGLNRAGRRGASSKLLTSLANSLLWAGQAERAIEVLEHVIELRPEDPHALGNLSVALRRTAQVERSIEIAQRAVALAPELTELHLLLGRSLEAVQRVNEARDVYKRAIEQGVTTVAKQQAVAHLKRLSARPKARPMTESKAQQSGVLAGDLDVLHVPEILEVIRFQSATGQLKLQSGTAVIKIDFSRGRIVGAAEPDGNKLVVDAGTDVVADQTPFVRLIANIADWRDGQFEFIRTKNPHDELASIDPQLLLLEAFRTSDEAERNSA